MNQLMSNDIKMTSLDIAELTGKMHKHVMADIRKEIEELGADIGQPIFRPSSYINKQNKEQPCYSFGKEGAMQLALKYDAKTRYKVIKRIEELENKKSEIDTSQLSPELQMMNQMFIAVAKNELETKEAKQLALQANEKAENISNIVTMDSIEWRKKINTILNKIAENWSGVEPYKSVRNYSYEKLEQRANCKLDIRLNNRKERAVGQGMSKTYVSKISKLDCIAEDKRLTEIYIQVIKEMAIQFRVNINNFKFEGVV